VSRNRHANEGRLRAYEPQSCATERIADDRAIAEEAIRVANPRPQIGLRFANDGRPAAVSPDSSASAPRAPAINDVLRRNARKPAMFFTADLGAG
jgi:hypothetical protein